MPFTLFMIFVNIKLQQSVQGQKAGGCMTGKEIVNLIRSLRAEGVSDTKILNLIEYIETHDPKENDRKPDNN